MGARRASTSRRWAPAPHSKADGTGDDGPRERTVSSRIDRATLLHRVRHLRRARVPAMRRSTGAQRGDDGASRDHAHPRSPQHPERTSDRCARAQRVRHELSEASGEPWGRAGRAIGRDGWGRAARGRSQRRRVGLAQHDIAGENSNERMVRGAGTIAARKPRAVRQRSAGSPLVDPCSTDRDWMSYPPTQRNLRRPMSAFFCVSRL
jgi:hypothetical protein